MVPVEIIKIDADGCPKICIELQEKLETLTKEVKTMVPFIKQVKKMVPITRQIKTMVPTIKQVKKMVPVSRQVKTMVPIVKQVKTMVPVQRQVKTMIPIKREVRGTKEVITNVTINKQVEETFTKMVPKQFKRLVNQLFLFKYFLN